VKNKKAKNIKRNKNQKITKTNKNQTKKATVYKSPFFVKNGKIEVF
jgi:hypothetical protein